MGQRITLLPTVRSSLRATGSSTICHAEISLNVPSTSGQTETMPPPDFSSSRGTPQFAFVADNSQAAARSHAMREHWKQRHRRQHETHSRSRRACRTLLPRFGLNDQVSDDKDDTADGSSTCQQPHPNSGRGNDSNIAAQLLCGVSRALVNSRPDPFQTCPVHLTSQHQKLLHHWICTHAAMMFEDLDTTIFNPMRDVWFPLDLSNASSFNCVMAHSAAHLAYLYAGSPPRRGTKSSDALKYKAKAVGILRSWMVDPKKELSDDAFAAVIRLLTFERYWGTDTEWKIHRDGLQMMIEARGGVEKLHGNWRLELVVYLVSLMSRPSWLESTNKLEEISSSKFQSPIPHPNLPSLDVQKVRCLWLVSFIQDIRTFMGSFNGVGLLPFPSLHTAIRLLRDNCQLFMGSSRAESYHLNLEYEMLACLFFIGIILQESMSLPYEDTSQMPDTSQTLGFLDMALRESQDAWRHSIYNLQHILYQTLMGLYDSGGLKVNYVVEMAMVVGTLSSEARHGVQKCLLNLFCSSRGSGNILLIDDGWTPDSLLSSIRGH